MTFKFPPVFIAFKNCAEIYKSAGKSTDGIYTIKPDNMNAFEVFCDQTTAGGGWTVFQRRLDGSVDFYRLWNDYKHGFGDLCGEFWLGLDKIHRLTSGVNNVLRVDLGDFEGKNTYAEYEKFGVMGENDKYKLILGSYSGRTVISSLLSSHAKNGRGERRVLSDVNMLKLFYINSFGRQKSNLSSSICNPGQHILDVG